MEERDTHVNYSKMGRAEIAPKAQESIIWSQDPQRKQRPLKPKGIYETVEHLLGVNGPHAGKALLGQSQEGSYYFCN